MTGEEFEGWFRANLDVMVGMGIVHHRSEKARTIHAFLNALEPMLNSLSFRIEVLEKATAKSKRTRKKVEKVSG